MQNHTKRQHNVNGPALSNRYLCIQPTHTPRHTIHTYIRRANPCDPALKPLNLEITSDISLHKQNLWKEHLNANWDHRHNTHTLWKTIHGLSNRAAPTPQNCTITFNKKIATSPKNIVNCFTKHRQTQHS